MNIVGITKRETDIRSKASTDSSWNIGKLEANKYVHISGQEKYGTFTFYLIEEGQYVYGEDIIIVQDKEFYFKEYTSNKLIKRNNRVKTQVKRGLSYHTEIGKETTELYDELQKFNFLTNAGFTQSGSILDGLTGSFTGGGNIIPGSAGSGIGFGSGSYSGSLGVDATPGLADIGKSFGFENDVASSILEGTTVDSLFDGSFLGIVTDNVIGMLDGLLSGWLGSLASYVVGFGFSSLTLNNRRRFGSLTGGEYKRPRFDSGGSANTEQITQRQIEIVGMTRQMIDYFTFWDYSADQSEQYSMMSIPQDIYFRQYTSFYPQVKGNRYTGLNQFNMGTIQYQYGSNSSNESGASRSSYNTRPQGQVQFFNSIKGSDPLGLQMLSGEGTVNDELKKLHDEIGLYADRKTTFTQFNRFRVPTLDNILTTSRGHIFFTRPDLNFNYDRYSPGHTPTDNLLTGQDAGTGQTGERVDAGNYVTGISTANRIRYGHGYPIFKNIQSCHSTLAKYLTSDATSEHGFIPKLTDCCTGLDISDEVLETYEAYETFTGWKTMYGTSTIKSRTAGTVSLAFTDDNMLSVYKMMKLWTEYINAVWRGEVSPKQKNLENSILDYAISIYYFLTDVTDTNILFYTKFTGCFPLACPSSKFTDTGDNYIKSPTYDIPFSFSKKDDYNPINIVEFNNVAAVDNNNPEAIDVYNTETFMAGKTFVGAPFVDTRTQGRLYKLRFRPNPKDGAGSASTNQT